MSRQVDVTHSNCYFACHTEKVYNDLIFHIVLIRKIWNIVHGSYELHLLYFNATFFPFGKYNTIKRLR